MMTFLHTVVQGPGSFHLAALPPQYSASISKSKTAAQSAGGRSRDLEDLMVSLHLLRRGSLQPCKSCEQHTRHFPKTGPESQGGFG